MYVQINMLYFMYYYKFNQPYFYFELLFILQKYWLVLLEKISELESNYSRLNQNYTNSGEKLQNVTSERDKLLE